MAFLGQTGNVFRLRPGRGLTAGIRVGTQSRETMIMARAAAADGASAQQGDPFAVDQDRAVAELKLARAWYQAARLSGAAAAGSGPIVLPVRLG